MDRSVLDLLDFYRRDLQGHPEGQRALAKLHVTAPEVAGHFQMGWCSGKALKAASEEQYRAYVALGLAKKRQETFIRCLVLPVFDVAGELVDRVGIRRYGRDVRYLGWKEPAEGLIGALVVKVHQDVILCDTPLHALHCVGHGFANVVAIRKPSEIAVAAALMARHGVRRVFVVTRQAYGELAPVLSKAGMQPVKVQVPSQSAVIPRERMVAVVGGAQSVKAAAEARLVSREEGRIVLEVGGVTYRLDGASVSGLGIRALVRAERGGATFIDRADLASSSSRRKFGKPCGMKLGVPATEIEEHLAAITEKLDALESEAVKDRSRAPRELSAIERESALAFLRKEDILARQTAALESCFNLVAEEENKKLALLVAASRLLAKPLGAIVRGPAGCGKSALIQGVARVLPVHDVLNFSRLTAQSLFFLPADSLKHRVLVCDEYAGLQEAEYGLRTMMSSQVLSLAITVREGGRVPTTRTVEIPAKLAVLVSSTMPVNIENLSRFIELKMDDSAEQTRRVMLGLAGAHSGLTEEERSREIRKLQDAAQMLRPCAVTIPFANRLVFASTNVLARRQFAQVVGLIAAHAALNQYQREAREENGQLVVTARKADYQAVFPLLASIIEHFEEEVSPAGMELLRRIRAKKAKTFTRSDAMGWTGWSYSKTWRTLRELCHLDLLVADGATSGALKTYAASPCFQTAGGIMQMVPPSAL